MRKFLSNYCALPFVHLAVESNGDVKGCCLTPAFKDKKGEPFNLNTHSLDDLKKCEDYKNFKKSFRNNEQHSYCNACWVAEQQGIASNRMSFTKNFKHLDDEKKPEGEVGFIELKMGNRCNLKCAICNPQNSSFWAEELKEKTRVQKIIKQTKWIEKEKIFESDFVKTTRYFHLMGGEPFLVKQNKDLLQFILDEGKPEETVIWYNTNGTIFPEPLLPYFEKFKKIRLSISIDDYGKRFEFQRFPGKWEKALKVLKEFNANHQDNMELSLDLCWSVWNTFYIKDIGEVFDNLYDQELNNYQNKLYSNRHFYTGQKYALNNLRNHEKETFKEKLTENLSTMCSQYRPILKQLLNWIDAPQDTKESWWEVRNEEIRRLEKVRNISFKEASPELEELFFK